jgi:EAL domain-containing protein (putative c-di-GMP-specific phosphodiesterase class I)
MERTRNPQQPGPKGASVPKQEKSVDFFSKSKYNLARKFIMLKIFYFDYCAVFLFCFILMSIFYRRLTTGQANRVFLFFTLTMLLDTLCDIGMEIGARYLPLNRASLFATEIFSYGYFFLRNSTNFLYVLFIRAITRTSQKRTSKRDRVLLTVPYILIMIFIASNVFHQRIFTVTAEKGYSRGPLLPALYAGTLLYAAIGLVYLISCFKYLQKDRWAALTILYPVTILAVIFQYFFPQYMVEMFSMAVAMLTIFQLVLRPEEIMDTRLGLFNDEAYKNEIRKIVATKQSADLVLIRMTNSYQVRSFLGEEKFNSYILKIARVISKLIKEVDIPATIFFDQSGCFSLLFDADFDNMEQVVPEKFKEFKSRITDVSEYGLRLEPKICSLRFPDDISDFESLMHFGRIFPSLMNPAQVYTSASALVSTKDFQLQNKMDIILKRAIRDHNLRMFYQPIYSVKDRKFISAEALIRLQDPEFGFVPPGLFIPAAEKNGLILSIGDFVLEDVYRFIASPEFKALGLDYIEVNLSVSQCVQRNLTEKIFSLQEKYGVPPDKINFEITETSYDNSHDVMDANIETLSHAGYSISLDDYGTGYSNMQRVLRIPLNIVKIDKSLVDNMNTTKGQSIVKSTIRMMQDIDMELVAEGVETKETLDNLEEMNADFIQGYYFSKPLPEKDFIEFIRNKNEC